MGSRIPETVRCSFWMDQALAGETAGVAEPLHGPARADVCVVGGGFTGLWTALALKERDPSLAVILIEAEICGAGASGANGGFAMTWWPKWDALRRLAGTDAEAVARASGDAVTAIGAFARDNDLDIAFRPAGWLWAATNPAQAGAWDRTVSGWARSGLTPFRPVDAGTAARLTGSDVHLGGVFETGVATLHPGRLVRGLRRVAVARGIRVFERTPMLRLERHGSRTRVKTAAGTVDAEAVVLATNAALAGYREIRRHLLVLGSDVIATEPRPQLLGSWQPGLAVSDSRRLVHYYRTTEEGRVVFGKGGGRIGFGGRVGPGFRGRSDRVGELNAHLARILPRLDGVPVTHAWSGAVDYSIDSMPFFGTLGSFPGVHYVAGYSGDGVGPSRLAGQVLASLALGTDDQWSRFPLVRSPRGRLPPEPLRYLGGHLVKRAISRKEDLEDQGRGAGRLTAALAGLDPTSFVG